ncbi:MAG: cyclopropane-fatty-acyl-phospholipid synthase [Acidocella sp.]|nr:cyclopropane-fatty-acyl-phospholipid synthase [Acidocella sp.]
MSSMTADLESMPGLPLHRASHGGLRRLFAQVRYGCLTIDLPNGIRITHDSGAPGPSATWCVHRWRGLRRLLLGGDIGFAEAYLDEDWSSPDLPSLIEFAARNLSEIPAAQSARWPLRLLGRLRHAANRNSRAGSKRNIMCHYDLGNEFYRLWLDSGMSYSSALFTSPEQSLEDAQTAKQDRILAMLDLQPGQRVLEIGCGWGGLAERIASAGCHVTALTLSPAQHRYSTERLSSAGLAGRSEVLLQDYRDVTGRFDRIVSVEMLEAVGEAYWPRYFETLRARLAPEGRVVLQAITIADAKFEMYRRSPDFIQHYVFPGGMLPAPRILGHLASAHDLAVHAVENFGQSYALTLALWRERFEHAWPEIAKLGFAGKFRRLWQYYLAYCEGGFRSGHIDVGLWLMGDTAC